MAVCKKVLLVWCLIIAQSCALRIAREAEAEPAKIAEGEEPEKKAYGHDNHYGGHHDNHYGGHHGHSSESMPMLPDSMSDDLDHAVPPQRKCPEYHSCMNKLDELQDTMKSLKSERAVMMGTLKTIIKKAKDSQENINKLTKKQKALAMKYSEHERIIKPNEVKIARNVRKIDAYDERKDALEDMIDNWRHQCEDGLSQLTVDSDNDFGIYYIYNERDKQVTYFDAQERCRSYGMDLLTINSEDEYDYIKDKLLDLVGSDHGMEDTGFWIGMNTLAEPNNLRWISTGTSASIAFTIEDAWQEDEPDYGDAQQYRTVNWYEYEGDYAWSVEHYLDTSCFVCKASDLCYDIMKYDAWVEEENLSDASESHDRS